MRNLLLSLFVFIVVAGCVFCMSWFLQARQIRKGVEHAIALINNPQPVLTYDAMETSGFPSDVLVSVTNPHFKGRVDTLLQQLVKQGSLPDTASIRTMPQWDEDVKLNGRIVLGINALSDHYSAHIQGNSDILATIKGQSTHVQSNSDGDNSCLLQLERATGIFGALWNAQTLARDSQSLLRDFRLLDCNFAPYSMIDVASNSPTMSSGGGRLYLSRAIAGTDQSIRLFTTAIDAEVKPQGDAAINAYASAFTGEYPFQSHFSYYGKQNMTLDASYSGPIHWQSESAGKTNFDISVNSFTIANAVYNASVTFRASNHRDDSGRESRLLLNAQSSFTEAYGPLLHESIRNAVYHAYADQGQHPLPASLQRYTPDAFYALINPAIPDLHALGAMKQAVDLSFKGSDDFKTGNVNLAALELSGAPYGITGNGTAALEPAQLPTAHASFTCMHCPQLIDDVSATINRVSAIAQAINPETRHTIISSQLAGGIKNFALALAEPAADPKHQESYSYRIESNGLANTTVSGKRLDQVMALFGQMVSPYLSQPGVAPAPH